MENLKEERKRFESLGMLYPEHKQVTVEKGVVAGVDTYRFTPRDVVSHETVIFTHGGGYMFGSIRSHRALVSHIAATTGRTILFVEYSLSPEARFPKALNEVTSVVQELSGSNSSFALMGDSAGGNLAMSTALNLKKLNMPLPLYQVLISPWLNMSTDAASYTENEKNDPVLTKDFMKHAAESYTDHKNITDPLVSPVLGSFEAFSPTLTLVGNEEILRDDSLALHHALTRDGRSSTLKIFEKVTHVWPLTDISSIQSVEALRLIREFMDSQK
jgi:acetyl esterase/lipase